MQCGEEFFRLTRRKRVGVVRYVKRAATQSGGKITVTHKKVALERATCVQ